MKLEGVYLPVTTPFDPARGGIDLDGFGQNLRAWGEHPVAGYVVAGSTGEAPFLDETEIVALVAKARDVVGDTAAVLAGTGLESTRATIRLGQAVAEAGAEALLVRPPSYYRGPDDARGTSGPFPRGGRLGAGPGRAVSRAEVRARGPRARARGGAGEPRQHHRH